MFICNTQKSRRGNEFLQSVVVLLLSITYTCRPDSSSVQRLATGWTVRGSNPGRPRLSVPVQTGPGAHPASCTKGTGSFPGVRNDRGVTLTPLPILVSWSRKSGAYFYSPYGPYGLYRTSVPVQYSYTSTPPIGRTACTEPQYLYRGVLYL